MPAISHSLNLDEEKVFLKVREQVAMPLLEIAATTGVQGDDLDRAIQSLESERMISVQHRNDPFQAIVSVSGRSF